MKQQINEIKRMQQLAGIIKEGQLNEVLNNDMYPLDFLQKFLNKKFNGKYIIGFEDKGKRQFDIVLGTKEIPFDFSEGSTQKLGLKDIYMQGAGRLTFSKGNPMDPNSTFSAELKSDSDYEANVEIIDNLINWINYEKKYD